MIQLQAKGTPSRAFEPFLARIVRGDHCHSDLGGPLALVASNLEVASGNRSDAACILIEQSVPNEEPQPKGQQPLLIHGCGSLQHLSQGDVVRVHPHGSITTVYRRESNSNTLFLTERCNSFCIMCSQPPRQSNDFWRVAETLQLIKLVDPDTATLGITGGEPTLLKDDFLLILRECRDRLPNTAMHVLSNGRMFYYLSFARAVAAIQHPSLVLGIPLYSDLDHTHDYVVQAQGAFAQTVLGLHNLARAGVKVELRMVVHSQTHTRLPQFADYVVRNLPFASHVAIMGLEPMGFGAANFEELWIDPVDYGPQLSAAVTVLHRAGMNVSLYNHQLCTIDRILWPFARQSISDWKNLYLPECNSCSVQSACCGFFKSSQNRHSRGIKAFQTV